MRLPMDSLERLSKLFEALKAEAGRLGRAYVLESTFGFGLAGELTGKGDVKRGIAKLYSMAIEDIDHEIARILGLERSVETVKSRVLDMVRMLSQAGEAGREAIKGSGGFRG